MSDPRVAGNATPDRGHQPPRSLTLIGYWEGPREAGWPDVTTFVDEGWDPEERDDVFWYLRDGIVVATFMGYSTCRFCGIDNGDLELSDGVFVWPQGLAHYIADHGVRLPEVFVHHVRAWTEAYDKARLALETSWWRSFASGPVDAESP